MNQSVLLHGDSLLSFCLGVRDAPIYMDPQKKTYWIPHMSNHCMEMVGQLIETII